MNLPISGTSIQNKLDWINFKSRQSLDFLLLPFDYFLDNFSLWFHSRLSPFSSKRKKHIYDLVFFSHTIEKGLSLPQPKEQFGRSNISRVIRILKLSKTDELPEFAISMAMGSLASYLEFHSEREITSPLIDDIQREFIVLKARYPEHGNGGCKDVREVADNIKNFNFSYSEFLFSRYSCRAFIDTPLEATLFLEIAKIAQQAPSQCNRQSSRLHVFQNPADIQRLLGIQGGARGFAQQVPGLIVVTSDLCAWMSRAERNQCFVDAGIYAMSFLLSCHARGLGACSLNFSKTHLTERRFKREAGIPSSERIALLIAVGWPSKTHNKAAFSARYDSTQIITFHTT